MIQRRELIMGLACALSAGAAYAAKPRREVNLLGKAELAEVVPEKFGAWTGVDVGDPMALNQEDSLAAKLYSQLVTRAYVNDATGQQVFMLLAYGSRQTDELQLHRPEVCYPAFGFALTRNEPAKIPVGHGVVLPARRLQAEAAERRESLVYWSRLGEFLPQDGSQQREARFRNAFQGIIPDGMLTRFSATGEPEAAWASIDAFIGELFAALPRDHLDVFIGEGLAKSYLSANRG